MLHDWKANNLYNFCARKKKPSHVFEKAEIIDAPWKLNKNIPLSPKLGSEWAQQSARASEASSAEQANKWAVQANERADEAHYICTT